MPLNTTPGDPAADSFATLAELNTYAANRPGMPEWFATATDAQKEAAMRIAAKILDACFDWTGAAVTETQALTWPRTGMFTRNKFPIPSSGASSITSPLKDAQCELAIQAGAGDLLAENDAKKQGIASVKAGSVAVTFQNQDSSTKEAVDIFLRRMGSEFLYVSDSVPQSVRMLLVPSWFKQPTVIRDILFENF